LYDYEAMAKVIEREGITNINCTPSAFYPLVEEASDPSYRRLRSLKQVFLGGEPINRMKLEAWLQSGHCQAQLVNTYGPTECTDIASYSYVEEGSEAGVPIGRPIDNVRLYVLDNDRRLVPQGVEGELYIGGVGVGRGYFRAAELTAERFVAIEGLREQALYRTGDRVKRLADGQLMFIGRMDHQVKIRGYRIELEEIQNKMLAHGAIREAVVVVKGTREADKQLCAFYVAAHPITEKEITEYLAQKLPHYMLPSVITELSNLPLNVNGKIDLKRLMAVELPEADDDTKPSDEVEERVAEICMEVLQLERIGVHANLFSLGGNSLKMIVIASRLSTDMGLHIPAGEVYTRATIAGIASYIKEDGAAAVSGFEDSALTLIKKGRNGADNLFFIHDISGDIDAYFGLSGRVKDRFTSWGIQADRAEFTTGHLIEIPEIASMYKEKIKQIQPDGPYYFCSWSLGGTIAFEICRQLEAEGHEIGMLTLIDSTPPRSKKSNDLSQDYDLLKKQVLSGVPDSASDWKRRIEGASSFYQLNKLMIQYFMQSSFDYSQMESFLPIELLRVMPEKARKNKEQFLSYFNLFNELEQSFSLYEPEDKVFAQIHLVKAAKSQGIDPSVWSSYCYSTVEVYEIVGDHFSIFHDPDIEGLAAVFESIIELSCS
jgi:surfactin family lipopeptide synthetase A/fengycin family lipopeptide synthetase D